MFNSVSFASLDELSAADPDQQLSAGGYGRQLQLAAVGSAIEEFRSLPVARSEPPAARKRREQLGKVGLRLPAPLTGTW